MSRTTWRAVGTGVQGPSDVSAQIVWGALAGIAVLDHAGRLAYANPSFRQDRAFSGLVDAQGYLTDGTLERARRRAVEGRPGSSRTLTIGSPADGVEAELIPLRAAEEWSALVVRHRASGFHQGLAPTSPALMVHELLGAMLPLNETLDELTRLAEDGPDPLRAAVARQARSLSRLRGLVTALGDLNSAAELERADTRGEPVDLAELVRDVADQFRDLAAASGHDLEVELEQGLPPLPGHRLLLARALANLVDNAIKYAPAGSPIQLKLRRQGALALIEVADQGPGIPPGEQERVFEEFVRLPHAIEGGAPGTGLGLAVARRVAEGHGGLISLTSRPGGGAVFALTFLLGQRGT